MIFDGVSDDPGGKGKYWMTISQESSARPNNQLDSDRDEGHTYDEKDQAF